MKTFIITYDGYASRFKNLNEKVEAETAREAVETFYANKLPDKYFPDEDENVFDSDGDWVAEAGDTDFYYDGGYFRATDVDEYVPEDFNSEAVLKEEMSEAFSYKDENGNIVFPKWQVIALMEKYAKLACEAQKVACAVNVKVHCTWDDVIEDSILNSPNVMGL